MANISNLESFPFVKMCQINDLEGIEFGDDPYVTSGVIAEKREGESKT